MVAPSIVSFSAEKIRQDFPILSREVHPGVPLIYLDSGATSQKPLAVLEAEDTFYRQTNANVHRGVHAFSEKATSAYEGARDKVRAFINARSSQEIVFTRNTTESINLVAYAWGLSTLKPGDEIVTTEMEHHSNIVPWQIVAGHMKAVVRFVPITDDGQLDLAAYRKLLESGRVKLVSVSHASNVLGTINPVAEVVAAAHAAGALTVVDAAQSAPHLPLDVQALDADFVAFSGHKMLGPTGIGVLYGKRAVLQEMPPFLGGGSMIKNVTMEGTTFADLPQRYEAGTPAIAQAIGLGAAIDYLNGIGLAAIHEHEVSLVNYALERLEQIPGLTLYGPRTNRVGAVSFTLKGVHPHDIAQGLDSAGIAIRAGHHCAQPLHHRYGLTATARASFYLYNTRDEVDKLVETLEKVRAMFARRG
ncbi:MAG TPA: cysteine desulfurase [Aggregatilineales bacterium]|nr:cysteine desulfurase [Aggregatilineales bacterium]